MELFVDEISGFLKEQQLCNFRLQINVGFQYPDGKLGIGIEQVIGDIGAGVYQPDDLRKLVAQPLYELTVWRLRWLTRLWQKHDDWILTPVDESIDGRIRYPYCIRLKVVENRLRDGVKTIFRCIYGDQPPAIIQRPGSLSVAFGGVDFDITPIDGGHVPPGSYC